MRSTKDPGKETEQRFFPVTCVITRDPKRGIERPGSRGRSQQESRGARLSESSPAVLHPIAVVSVIVNEPLLEML